MCISPEIGRPDLLSGERVLLGTLRRLALGAGQCLLLRPALEEACGPAGAEAFRTLEIFMRALSLHAERRVELTHPNSVRITEDEEWLLDAFAYAQADLYAWTARSLAEVLGCAPSPTLIAASDLIAQAFLHGGLLLSARGRTEAPIILQSP